MTSASGQKFGAAPLSVFINFVIIIGFMLTGLIVAKQMVAWGAGE